MGLDSSGQGNNLTVNGTILQSKDTPTNIYPVLNQADNAGQNTILVYKILVQH